MPRGRGWGGVTVQNEVNAIKWDPTGSLLASCSDDMTLKVRRRLPARPGPPGRLRRLC